MRDLQHDCRHATMGLKTHIRAYRRATNEIVAEKEWMIILAALKRIEDAIDAYKEKGGCT